MRTLGLLAVLVVVTAFALAPAAARPVAIASSDDAEASLLAVSLTGNATCTTSTCFAVSLSGDARAGCYNATSCDDADAPCAGFACVVLAASPLGDAEAYTYCTLFGQICAALALDRDAYLYECHGDINQNVICHGI